MTAPIWTPQLVVDVATARALVEAAFPALRGASVVLLAEGWDNTVHLVDGQWAFRFPRRAVAVHGVRAEIVRLPRLAPLLPLPVPVPEWVGELPGPAGEPWPYFGARLLPGVELAESQLLDGERAALGERLGAFLRALHDPALAAREGDGLATDPMRRADPSYRVPMARERLATLEARGAWRRDAAVDALLEQAEPLGPADGPLVLSHGDLHLRHVLVHDRDAGGVIDFGDLCLADPAVDLSIAYAAFAGADRAALLAAYGRPVPPDRELRARSLAVMLCSALAEKAHLDGWQALLDESLAGLRRATED